MFRGFKAAWFFAASPINRSLSEKATKDGVTRFPCSLATDVEGKVSLLVAERVLSLKTPENVVDTMDGETD